MAKLNDMLYIAKDKDDNILAIIKVMFAFKHMTITATSEVIYDSRTSKEDAQFITVD